METNPKRSRAARAAAEARLRRRGASRLSALLRRPEISALARAGGAAGAEVWLVGGALRDLLLGRVVPDVDAAVSADPLELARRLSREGYGTAVLLSEAAPRVVRLAGRREIDLALVEGATIENDLARRDFTVNAIAVSLLTRSWIDPFGGIGDLASSRLRLVVEPNIAADPLRALRAARFLATHGLVPDRAATAACARAAPLLSSAAPERSRVELVKMLAAPEVGAALRWAARTGVLAPALGLPLSTSARTRLLRRPFDAKPLVRESPDGRVRLRLCLLAAGLGIEADDAAPWLQSRRFSRAEASGVAALLRLTAAARKAASDLEQWNWVRDAGLNWREALLLAALLGVEPGRRACLSRRARTARRPPRVDGGDVIRWLAIPPGPRVGALLREVEVEGIRGGLATRSQARRWLRARALALPADDRPKGAGGRL